MIEVERETKLIFSGDEVRTLTQMARYLIEVIQTKDVNGYGWDKEQLEDFRKLAYRFSDAIPNESRL